MAERQRDPARVTLKDVRLSYAALFRAKSFGDGEGEPKFSANFLIDDSTKIGKANLTAMDDAIDHVKQEKWPKGAPKLAETKICLRDGNNVDSDGYEDMMFVSANNGKKPLTLDRDKSEVVEADNVLYSGCYVDAILRVWAQDNKWGKRVNASLEAVRFRRDGEAFGAVAASADEFDDLEDDDRPSRSSRRGRGEDEDEKPSSRRRSRDDDDEKPASRHRGRDDEEDERPARRRSRDEEDDEKPASRRRGSRDEDDEDRPSRSSRRSRDDEDEKPASRRRGRDDEDERPSRRSRDEDDDEDRPSRNSRARRRGRDDDDVV